MLLQQAINAPTLGSLYALIAIGLAITFSIQPLRVRNAPRCPTPPAPEAIPSPADEATCVSPMWRGLRHET